MATKLIWMSDPHFQNAGTIDGLDPRVRLETALEHANTHHDDAEFIVLSGDLVGDDIEGDYALLSHYLARSDLPVLPMMGNNDERAGMRMHLSLPDTSMPDFVQYTRQTDDGLMVFLDTHKIGSHAGELCADRLEWLDQILTQASGTDAYIFMHHPPHALGLPPQDEIMLQDGPAFFDRLARHGHVRHLFMGHVHRTTSGVMRGIPFASLGALSFQAPAPRPAWGWDNFTPPKEAPQYAVVMIEDGDVVVQYTQFCAYETGVLATE